MFKDTGILPNQHLLGFYDEALEFLGQRHRAIKGPHLAELEKAVAAAFAVINAAAGALLLGKR